MLAPLLNGDLPPSGLTTGKIDVWLPYMANLVKTTVYLDRGAYRRLKALAAERARPVAELIREAVGDFALRQSHAERPSSIGIGRSGRGDLSERVDDLLRGMGAQDDPC